MSEALRVDWNHNPQSTRLVVLSTVVTAVGVLATMAALSNLFGALLLTAAVILLAVGLVGWIVLTAMAWRQKESRNQMITICAAVVRDEQQNA